MLKNFSLETIRASMQSRGASFWVRVTLGVLLLGNLIAAYFVFYPVGGTSEEMESKRQELVKTVRANKQKFDRTRLVSTKVEKGKLEGDTFLSNYFLDRRVTYSTVTSDLATMARTAGIRQKEQAMNEEPIEGSDIFSMLTITGNYEGNYGDLVKFVQLIDRNPRLLVLEQLSAAPQAQTGLLSVSIKINTFIRDNGELQAVVNAPVTTQEARQ